MKPGNLRARKVPIPAALAGRGAMESSSRFSRGVLFCHEKQNGRIPRTAMLDGEYETEVHFL